MAVRVSLSRFPIDEDVLETSGLPWGITVTPFASEDEDGRSPLYGSDGYMPPRCENCYGYFNTYCELDQWSWNCALCGTLNGLSSKDISRYSDLQSSPEMSSSFIDLELPSTRESLEEDDVNQACPVYVALVDLSSSEEFLELTRSALQASLEALGIGALFGIVTFSQKIGLYDVHGPIPVVKNVFIPSEMDNAPLIDLGDVMPLRDFLAHVDTCKDLITAALNTLRPTSAWERTTSDDQRLDSVLLGGRGLGGAMESLLTYLGSGYGNIFCLATVCVFLSGPPDHGVGQLDTRRYGEQYASKGMDADTALLPEQTRFYKDLAAIAVEAGVCVHMFVVTNEYTDLASLKFLSIESGGSLFLYSSIDDSTLPQDMYQMFSRPYAFGCVLRLRTSSEFKSCSSYGHFFQDPQYENVQHIIGCDSYATYAYDFNFSNTVGFSRYRLEQPVLQVAFQYTIIQPLKKVPDSGDQYSICHRLRIRTLQFGIAQNISEVFNSVDSEVVLSILVHKAILASFSHGIREARILLHDWLVILTARFNESCHLVECKNGKAGTWQVDVTFSDCSPIQPLPRFVFALLRNPLLGLHEEGVHPDYRIYLQSLFCALEPSSLRQAIYPVLMSYSTPDEQTCSHLLLSRSALLASSSPIFLLDAFTTLMVFYSSAAGPEIPFPPPQDCLLRSLICKLKQDRCVTPKILFVRGGDDDASLFESYLMEEPNVAEGIGKAFANATSYVSFLDDISQCVLEYTK